MTQLRKYAVHESSHAVFNWLNTGRLISVNISRDGLNNTTVINHPIFKVLHKITYDHIAMKSWINGLLAGPAGEMHLDGAMWNPLPSFLEDDVRLAMQAMKACGWNGNGYTCQGFFRDYGSWARVTIISHWNEILLLANELERRLQMSGQACARFLEGIWPEPLPDGILPWNEHGKG